jgi:5-methyltetrahydropteroyltriglutamate--homocysteine methyltransferase
MKRSTDRILTTHVGSLIRPAALQDIMRAKQGDKPYDQAAYETCLKQSVADVVGRQAEIGVDVIRTAVRKAIIGTSTWSSA